MSTIGSLLFIGRVSCPSSLHTASHFASKLKSLKVRHVKELNSRLKLAHMMDFHTALQNRLLVKFLNLLISLTLRIIVIESMILL
jgi:hypothetical protein